MRRPVLRLAVVTGLVLTLLGLAVVPGQALVAGSAPSAVVSPNPAVQDAVVEVRGNGWRALSMVTAVVCGNEALDGSKDCDLEGATVTQVFEDGTFMLRLLVRLPPSPCPCLIRITDIDSTTTYDLPFRIANAPVATPKASSPAISGVPPLTVVSGRVDSESSIASLFGAPAKRELVLQVRNDSSGTVTNPLVTAGWGRSGPQNTISSPQIDQIAPGEVREIRVPFELTAFAFGEYDVDGAVAAFGLPSGFESSTAQWPWGLLLIALVAVQLVVLWILRRNRRIRLQREAEVADGNGAPDAVASAAAGVPVVEPDPAEPPAEAHAGPDQDEPVSGSRPGRAIPAGDIDPPNDIRLDGPVTAAPWH